jgi:anti-sigma B factor antagonist
VKVGIRRAGRVTILDLDGSLRLGESEDTIREPLQQLIDSGANRVAFNLANLTDLDSSGIGVLMRSFISVSRAGGKSTFFSANHRVRMVLKMVRLDTVLDLVPDEATALSRL